MYTEHADIPQNTDCCSVGPLCDSMTEACQASLSFIISSSPEVCTNSCPLSWWCHPTISSSVVPFSSRLNPSRHLGISQWAGSLHQWTKYWGFSFSICPPNEYSGLIFFRIDWLDLLAVQETLKSLLQHHGSKASILWHSAFFILQLSHLYMTTGEKP